MKQYQLGRSMIEMLAVLVISAIIIFGGITGFFVAMNKLHSNEISTLITSASIRAQMNGKQLVLSDLSDKPVQCITALLAKPTGKVVVTFEPSSRCSHIEQLIYSNFPRCLWKFDPYKNLGIFDPKNHCSF